MLNFNVTLKNKYLQFNNYHFSKKHASDKMKNISSILNIKDAQESRSKRFLIATKKNRAHRRLQICLTLKNLDDMKEEMSIVLDNAKRKRIKYAQQSK